MNKTGRPMKYSQWDEPQGIECSLCGKEGGIYFKNAVVCEECLEYVKHIVS